jgi:hypothetical protein
LRRALLLLALLALATPARAQMSGNATGLGGPGTADLPALAEGSTITAVRVEGADGAPVAAAAEAAARRAFGLAPARASRRSWPRPP